MKTLACIATLLSLHCAQTSRALPFPADRSYEKPVVAAREPAAALGALREREESARRSLGKADLVFTGEVQEVGVSPGVGSGVAVVTQAVVYRVREVLRGPRRLERCVIHHVLLGPPPGEPADAKPRLDPALFRAGATLVVAAVLSPAIEVPECAPWGHLRWLGETDAGLPEPATPEVLAEVRRLMP
jgi:hypothetical protein